MNELIACGALFVVVAWLIVEFRKNVSPWIRVILGLFVIAGAVQISGFVATIGPNYERQFHRRGMRELEDTMRKNDFEEALDMVSDYNRRLAQGEVSYSAAMKLRSSAETDR